MKSLPSLALVAILVGSTLVLPESIAAHHSFAAEFDANKPVTLEGTLTRVVWANPHGWIYVDVTGADGTVVNWAIEFGSPGALLRRGLRVTDFPPGIKLIVKGYLAKNGTPTANAASVVLPDGRSLFTASSFAGSPDADKR
jgi:hypothetical protein